MALSGEDLLRLNVMMAQDILAVRIDENRMQVYGLTPDGEVRVDLNPAGRAEQYLKLVREFLSGHVFGSPGGYPVFISRWTRMGQAKDESLQKLLMLGEPEAVVAVVHARGLSPEVARCAWWCMPESENARRMLEKPDIATSELGPVLAEHLYEHLAFESDPRPMIDSVRLMLQPGLIDKQKQERLWRSSQRKNACLVGFLQALPEGLLHDRDRRTDFEAMKAAFEAKGMHENPYAQQLMWLLGESGQGYMDTVHAVMKKPANQDVVVYLLNTLRERLAPCQPVETERQAREIVEIDQLVNSLLDPRSDIFRRTDGHWKELVINNTDIAKDIYSMAWLAQLSEEIVTSIFSQTTAEGTLMRKKLQPVTDSIFSHIGQLMGVS